MRQSKYTQPAIVALSLMAFSPSDGARLGPTNPWQGDGVVISPFQEGVGGLQEGDVVVAVGGRSMEEWLQSQLTLGTEWQLDQIVDYQVKRGGELLDIRVRLDTYPVSAAYGQVWGY